MRFIIRALIQLMSRCCSSVCVFVAKYLFAILIILRSVLPQLIIIMLTKVAIVGGGPVGLLGCLLL